MSESPSLSTIIEQELLEPWFQPVVDLASGQVHGHEALIRGPVGSSVAMPDALFGKAIETGLLEELELCCRKVTLLRYAALRPPGKLFLNISASLLASPRHQQGFTARMLSELGIRHPDIVIELSEQHPFDRYGVTHSAVAHYREMGFEIAIDDLGSGYSGLCLWSDLRPEYVKIDKHFISGIDLDPVKREFVRAICNIARITRCHVVAEGIESAGELRVLQQIGVPFGQGFLLGRPAPQPVSQCVHSDSVLFESGAALHAEGECVAFSLLRETPTVSPDTRLGEVHGLLQRHPEITIAPVLKDGKPVGVVKKSTLLELFSTRYGRALYEHKAASKLLSNEIVIVEGSLSLSDVSQRLTDNDEHALQQEIIITRDGIYQGIGRVRDLLKQLTEMEINNARYANPLTLLPGNVPINREIDLLLKQGQPFQVAYFDLNHFKPFNDTYGYAQGDEVIRFLGDLLVRHAGSHGHFVGHVGGDDFVVLFRGESCHAACESILCAFDEGVRAFFSDQDLQRGGIEAVDRSGERCFYPVLGLAIGVVAPDPMRCSSFNVVAELAADAKKQAKAKGGSALFISRRRGSATCGP